MENLISICRQKGISLPLELVDLLENCNSLTVFNSTEELAAASTGGLQQDEFEVSYEVKGKGIYSEAIVHRVKNGISANYTDAYMRRRDPDTMVIADDKPTDKPLFKDRFHYEFNTLRKDTFDWLKQQDLGIFCFFAGRDGIGAGGIAVVPANAAFFAMGLSMLQQMVPVDQLSEDFKVQSVIYVAPPFRHTHFEGKQIVVHNRLEEVHELFSYNLYPGPSAKKGLYGVLLAQGEKENWITANCSTVQVVSPYDNTTTFMHEGANGGGKC